jgi:5-methylcytosine-specific restriction endonuclease McrA
MKARKKKRKRSAIVSSADKLYSKIIRSQGCCCKCNATEGLTTSHIISRRIHAMRWDLKNSICACWSCHAYWGDNPYLYTEYLREEVGEERLQELTLKHQNIKPMKDFELENIETGLKELYQRVKKGARWNSLKADWI